MIPVIKAKLDPVKTRVYDFHYDATHIFMSIFSCLCLMIHAGLLIAAYFRARSGDDLYFTYAVAGTLFVLVMGLVMATTVEVFLQAIKVKYDKKGAQELGLLPKKPKLIRIEDKFDVEHTFRDLEKFSSTTPLSFFGIYLFITLFFLSLNGFVWSLFVSLYHHNREFRFGYVYIVVDLLSGFVAPVLFLSSVTISMILLSYYTGNKLSIRNVLPRFFYSVKLEHRILQHKNPGVHFERSSSYEVLRKNDNDPEKFITIHENLEINEAEPAKDIPMEKHQTSPTKRITDTSDEIGLADPPDQSSENPDLSGITDPPDQINGDSNSMSEDDLVDEDAHLKVEYAYWEVLDKFKWDLKEKKNWYKWLEPHYSTWAFWIIICISSLVAFAQFIDSTIVEEMVSSTCPDNFDCFITKNSFNFEYFPCDSGNVTDEISINDELPVDFTLYCFRFKNFGFDSDVILAVGNAYALYLIQIAIFDKIVGNYYTSVHFKIDSFWTGSYLIGPASAIVLVFRNALFGNYQNLFYDVLRNWNIFNLLFYHVIVGIFIVTYRWQEQWLELDKASKKKQ